MTGWTMTRVRRLTVDCTTDPLSPDSLTDCEDPECCYSDACSRSQYCTTVPPPSALLNTSIHHKHFASFWDRHKFLIEGGSLQKFAKLNQFDKR